jgi:hypothetical protein
VNRGIRKIGVSPRPPAERSGPAAHWGWVRLPFRAASLPWLPILFVWAVLLPGLAAQSVTLEWDPNPETDLLGYNVYRSLRSGSGYVRLTSAPVRETRYTDRTVQPGTTYYYVCTAVNIALLESGYSNQVSVTIPQPPPSDPPPSDPPPSDPPSSDPPPSNPPPSNPPSNPPSEPAEEPPAPERRFFHVPVPNTGWGRWFEQTFVGVGVLAPADASASVRVEARDGAGRALVSPLAQLSLFPRQQRAFLASELRAPAGTAWLEIEGADSSLVMVGDAALQRLDALVPGTPGTDLLLPNVALREGETGLLVMANPSGKTTARLKLALMDDQGGGRAFYERTLAPGAMVVQHFSELVPAAYGGREGWLRITSDQPVTASTLVADEFAIAGVEALAAEPASELFAPHFAVGRRAGTSTLTLLSADSTASAGVEVRLVDDSGNSLARTELVLPRLGAARLDLGTLLGERAGDVVTGTLQVRVTGPVARPMVGWLRLQGPDGETATVLPLSVQGRRRIVFPHVAQIADGSIFTGVVIFNPGAQPASIWMEAWDAAGRWSAGRSLTVPAGRRLVGLLSGEVFFGPEFQQVGGHLRMWSSAPVIVFAAFGDSETTFLSAIAGR